jgi:hypothetical protein
LLTLASYGSKDACFGQNAQVAVNGISAAPKRKRHQGMAIGVQEKGRCSFPLGGAVLLVVFVSIGFEKETVAIPGGGEILPGFKFYFALPSCFG